MIWPDKWVAHGLCMDPGCAYTGDMEWRRDVERGFDFAICPSCDREWAEEEMAVNEDERKRLHGF